MTPTAMLELTIPAAQASMAATGVPASVTLAQCAVESGWLSAMPAGSNNPFGIKATHLSNPDSYVEAMTSEYAHGQLEDVEQPFEKYPDLATAFTAHANLISTAPRYAPAMAVKGDAVAFAQQLQACGYSTNRPPLAKAPPYYANILIEIIQGHNLTQYD